MAFRTEGTDLIFEGWEDGSAESPFTGNMLVRQVNITDSPKEVFVGYDLEQQFTPSESITVTSVDTTANTITYTPATDSLTGSQKTIMATGTPFQFYASGTVTIPSPFFFYKTYYAILVSYTSTSAVMKVAKNLADAIAGTAIDITTTGTTVFLLPVTPDFSGFSGPLSKTLTTGVVNGAPVPYPVNYSDTSGTAYQYVVDGNYYGPNFDQDVARGRLWYYIGVGLVGGNNYTGWTYMDTGAPDNTGGAVSATVVTVVAVTDVWTLTNGGRLAQGTAVRVVASAASGAALPAPLVAGTIYYACAISSSTFKLASTLALALANSPDINITNTGTGTLNIVFADALGLAANWGYVFVFRNYQIDLFNIATATWTVGWKTPLDTSGGFAYVASLSHRAITSQNNIVYFANGNTVGSITQTPGSTFDPATAATYVFLPGALANLPSAENVISMTELGPNLLLGGIFGFVYVWDQINQLGTSSPAIRVPESNISELVTVNTTTYIFAGFRGRIYQTNGTSAVLFKKLPDNTSGNIQPIFYFKCATTMRNELLFSIESYNNAGATIDGLTAEAGIWAIDLGTNVYSQNTANALRYLETFSCGLNTGMTLMFGAFILPLPGAGAGLNFVCGWNLTFTGLVYSGFDGFLNQIPTTNGGTPDINGAAQVLTDLVRVGSSYTKKTFSQVEFALSKNLAAGEAILIEARSSIDGSFTVVGKTTANAGGYTTMMGGILSSGVLSGGTSSSNTIPCLSDVYSVNFQGFVWLQLRATLYSVGFASSPSYVRLRDIRVR